MALGLPTLGFWTSVRCTLGREFASRWRPKHNIYAFDEYDLILLFVCQICHWIVKQKIETNEIYFKEIKKSNHGCADPPCISWLSLLFTRYLGTRFENLTVGSNSTRVLFCRKSFTASRWPGHKKRFHQWCRYFINRSYLPSNLWPKALKLRVGIGLLDNLPYQ